MKKKHLPKYFLPLIILLGFGLVAAIAYHFVAKPSAPFVPTIHYAKVTNATIAYYTRGQGEPLLLVPGFGMTMQDWDPLLLEQLSKHNTLIIFDYPGVGKSTGSLKDLTETQLADLIMQFVGTAKIRYTNVLGWSLGSFVAQRIAEKYPDKIDKLILVSVAFGGEHMISESKAVDLQFQKNLGGDWQTAYIPMMFPENKKAEMQAYITRVNDAVKRGESPAVPAQTTETKLALEQMFANQEEEELRYNESPNIQSPTLIITGDKDILVLPQNAKLVADRIPGSKLVTIPDAGHAVLFQNVDMVVKTINTFLQE